MGGWGNNQPDRAEERNLLVMIPGRNRRKAVIMADHYDTAYMEDCYYTVAAAKLARLAAAGADDNHSATAALMLGRADLPGTQPRRKTRLRRLAGASDRRGVSLRLHGRPAPRPVARGRLAPLARRIGQDAEPLRTCRSKASTSRHDRPQPRPRPRRVPDFARHQPASPSRLAYQAHLANMIWNAACRKVEPQRLPGAIAGAACAAPTATRIPAMALHPQLHGEIRPPRDPRSSLYNTDGQIFSDAGVPVVLFMENYDINRTGYHDTHDNMSNIDLDYGAAVAAIAIESVARAATIIN